MTVKIIVGDCRTVLATLPDHSVQACVTSPPYFGLRDYDVDGQIGLEETPDAFVAELVAIFREVRRVLRDDGTVWLNLGDSYANDTKWGGKSSGKHVTALHGDSGIGRRRHKTGLKSKDMIGIPWRVAFALQADGWFLRQDIIWSKPNPMPESITDRCAKSHEYLFLLSKSAHYHFDAEMIAEPVAASSVARLAQTGMRNKRSVWTVPTGGFSEAHFATFPPALIEPCILAGAPIGSVVLDPFGGAGTTGLVAERLGRNSILIELNPAYAAIAQRRIKGDLGRVSGADETLGLEPLPLFDGHAA